MSRPPQLTEASNHRARHRVFSDERSCIRLREEDRCAGVLQRTDAVQDEPVEDNPGASLSRERESAGTKTGGCENLNAFLVVRRIGNGKRAVGRHRKRERIQDAARLVPDVDDFPGAFSTRVHAIDDLVAPIEHEVLAGRRPLESRRIPKAAGDVRRNRVDGSNHLRAHRRGDERQHEPDFWQIGAAISS